DGSASTLYDVRVEDAGHHRFLRDISGSGVCADGKCVIQVPEPGQSLLVFVQVKFPNERPDVVALYNPDTANASLPELEYGHLVEKSHQPWSSKTFVALCKHEGDYDGSSTEYLVRI